MPSALLAMSTGMLSAPTGSGHGTRVLLRNCTASSNVLLSKGKDRSAPAQAELMTCIRHPPCSAKHSDLVQSAVVRVASCQCTVCLVQPTL